MIVAEAKKNNVKLAVKDDMVTVVTELVVLVYAVLHRLDDERAYDLFLDSYMSNRHTIKVKENENDKNGNR